MATLAQALQALDKRGWHASCYVATGQRGTVLAGPASPMPHGHMARFLLALQASCQRGTGHGVARFLLHCKTHAKWRRGTELAAQQEACQAPGPVGRCGSGAWGATPRPARYPLAVADAG
jgi:hypothetical protein